MNTYRIGEDGHHKTVERMIKKYHTRLLEEKVTFAILLVFAPVNKFGEPTGPGLTLHGYPVYATIKPMSLEMRTLGLRDALMKIDGLLWEKLSTASQNALIDHELTHVELVLDDHGTVYDSAGRPKLSMRQHDITHGWFTEVVERHGMASIEAIQANKFVDDLGQTYLDFGEGDKSHG